MISPRPRTRESLVRLVEHVDGQATGTLSPDTVPTGFPSLDKCIGGGFRHQDLIVMGGDVGSGKSALALAIALRTAGAGHPVAYVSGEMDENRIMERALAIEGRAQIDDLRTASLTDEVRACVGAAALALQRLPLHLHPIAGTHLDDALAPVWDDGPSLVIVDYLQLLPPPATKLTRAEDDASTLRALKVTALERKVALLVVAQLPQHRADRDDPRPSLDDFGALGAVKQHADTVLGIYREEMYRNDSGLDGATELLVAKNRNGPTGFVDLYFYKHCMRFEDMLDPDR